MRVSTEVKNEPQHANYVNVYLRHGAEKEENKLRHVNQSKGVPIGILEYTTEYGLEQKLYVACKPAMASSNMGMYTNYNSHSNYNVPASYEIHRTQRRRTCEING